MKLPFGKQRDRELDEEIRSHFDMAVRERIERGESPEEAQRAVRREFGNEGLVRETTRAMWGWIWLENLFVDFRYGWRMLRKSPGFTIAAIITLALGIGANTAIFSVVDAVMLRPLPVKNSAQLVDVDNQLRQKALFLTDVSLSYPEYQDLVRQSTSFSSLLAYDPSLFALEREGGSQIVPGVVVTGNYFSTLGVPAVLGRTFDAAEVARAGGSGVAVISYAFWQRQFGGKPDVLGETIDLNGHPFSVIGVAPESLDGMMLLPNPQIWVPLTEESARELAHVSLHDRSDTAMWVVGRLRPGVGMAQAQAEMSTIAARLASEYPKTDKDLTIALLSANRVRFFPGLDRTLGAASLVLMALVGMVLLIACANVAAMALARATSRRREVAVRMAVGAGRWRLIRQLLTESLILALAGGAAAVALATVVNGGLARVISALPVVSELNLRLGLRVDYRVMLFALLVVALATALFGLAPALEASSTSPSEALKEEGRSNTGSVRKRRLLSALVVAQVALSLVLLICAGLSLRSVFNAGRVPPGFDPHGVVTAQFLPNVVGYTPAQSTAFYDALLRRVRTLPGVTDASYATELPLTFGNSLTNAIPADRAASLPENQWPLIDYSAVGPSYFHTLRVPILRGRAFTERDTSTTPRVAIVNQAFAQRFWPGQVAIGKDIRTAGDKNRDLEVVGIAATGKYITLGENPRPFFYVCIRQTNKTNRSLIVRSAGPSAALLESIRQIAGQLGPTVPMPELETMTQATAPALLLPKLGADFFGLLGLLGLALACAGIYGVTSYSVNERTHEIGIRLALGAERGDVARLILRRSLGLTFLGVLFGLAGAFAATRVLSSILYGISATDPLTFAGVPLVPILIAALACAVPVRRAMRVDPTVALKYE